MNEKTTKIIRIVQEALKPYFSCIEVMGANACDYSKFIHYRVFIKADTIATTKDELNKIASIVPLERVHNFIRDGKFKHGANYIFDYKIWK